jgi:hypothetical protein
VNELESTVFHLRKRIRNPTSVIFDKSNRERFRCTRSRGPQRSPRTHSGVFSSSTLSTGPGSESPSKESKM